MDVLVDFMLDSNFCRDSRPSDNSGESCQSRRDIEEIAGNAAGYARALEGRGLSKQHG
jgi:hypothetical protein